MNNFFENPGMVLIGALMVLIAGFLLIASAPDMILFSGLFLLIGKVSLAFGGICSVLALYLLSR